MNESPCLIAFLPAPLVTALQAASPRLDLWAAAFDAWLETVRSNAGSVGLGEARRAWKSLLAFYPCPPWAVDRTMIAAWLAHLAAQGYSDNTRSFYRRRVFSFYRFCAVRPELYPAEYPLPALLATVPRPAFGPPPEPLRGDSWANYGHSRLLHPSEARALLNAIDRRTSIVAKRDYAFLLTLLLTGLTETELRLLRWEHLHFTPTGVQIDFSPVGPRLALPPAAWDALLDYLQSSGRYPGLVPANYLFPPLADPLLRPATGQPDEWQSDCPLSTEQLLVILKTYAAWAGLDPTQITYACLRHTAAVLCLTAGAGASDLQRFLGRKYLKETRRYASHLGRMLAAHRPRPPWYARPFSAPRGPYRRKRPYAQPGNRNHQKHGFYTRTFSPEDLCDPDGLTALSLDQEIRILRLLLRRAFRLSSKTENSADARRMLNTFGRTTLRLSSLLMAQKELETKTAFEELDQVIAQILSDLQAGENG